MQQLWLLPRTENWAVVPSSKREENSKCELQNWTKFNSTINVNLKVFVGFVEMLWSNLASFSGSLCFVLCLQGFAFAKKWQITQDLPLSPNYLSYPNIRGLHYLSFQQIKSLINSVKWSLKECGETLKIGTAPSLPLMPLMPSLPSFPSLPSLQRVMSRGTRSEIN